MSYPITKSFIPGLPVLPYRNGFSAYEGVVCHSTANYNDTATGERNYESSAFDNAFVHFFVDDQNIIQTADINNIAWGCGAIGNKCFVQVELCQTYDNDKFQKAYSRYVWLIAKILYDKQLGVYDGLTLVSHDWITKNLGGTTHSDPINYLVSHGISWAQHVVNVQAEYNRQNTWIGFTTGGYVGGSLGQVHQYIFDRKWHFDVTQNTDKSLSFYVGEFLQGSTEAVAFEQVALTDIQRLDR
jgi:N-acetylmuramoyl-L-alanine amidase CwlA